ncbi:MAG: hypothetical protein AAGF32_10840, partial [Pseudomonadota bacterium]
MSLLGGLFGGVFGSNDDEQPARQTTSQTTTRNPYGAARGDVDDILAQVRTLSGDMSQFVPVQGQTTQDALNSLEGIFRGSQTGDVYGGLRDAAVGANEQGLAYTTGVAQSDPAANPYLDQLIEDASANTAGRINGMFSGAGRYGSGAHTGVLADRLGQIETQTRYDDFNRKQGRIDGANNTLLQLGQRAGDYATAADQGGVSAARGLAGVGAQRDAYDTATAQAPRT